MAQVDLNNIGAALGRLAARIDQMERRAERMNEVAAYDASRALIGTGIGIKAGAGVTITKNPRDSLLGISASGTPAAHNILSSSHGDTLAASVAAGDLLIGNATPAWARLAIGTAGQKLINSGGLPAWANDNRGPLLFQIGDGVNAIAAGVYAEFMVGYACTVTSWTVLATFPQAGGAIQLDLWRTTYAAYDSGVTHPVAADTITGTDKPRIIATSKKGTSSALTGWTTALAKDDIVRINVDSATAVSLVLLSLDVRAAV